MKAIILCAGFGSRMGVFTQNLPKPMLPLGNRPMLEHCILNLKAAGVTEIGINVHYLADSITDYFKDGSQFGVHIHYVYEAAPTGTAGGVRSLQSFLKGCDHFFVLYGDIFTNYDFKKQLSEHAANSNATATIVLHKRQHSNSYILMNKHQLITQFVERPSPEERDSLLASSDEYWVNSGLYLFKSNVLELIPPFGVCDFPKDIFPQLVRDKALFGIPLTADRVAVDTPEKYDLAQKIMSSWYE